MYRRTFDDRLTVKLTFVHMLGTDDQMWTCRSKVSYRIFSISANLMRLVMKVPLYSHLFVTPSSTRTVSHVNSSRLNAFS